MDEQSAFRVACGFGGGCGRLGLTCGAVTGAYMVIGLKYGKVRADDNDAKEKTYAFVQEFSERFVTRNKSLNCTELLGCDLGTLEGRTKMKEQNLSVTVCEKLVKDAREILEEIL
jgi:C_GCAxxG_C_C family probable redox protein